MVRRYAASAFGFNPACLLFACRGLVSINRTRYQKSFRHLIFSFVKKTKQISEAGCARTTTSKTQTVMCSGTEDTCSHQLFEPSNPTIKHVYVPRSQRGKTVLLLCEVCRLCLILEVWRGMCSHLSATTIIYFPPSPLPPFRSFVSSRLSM